MYVGEVTAPVGLGGSGGTDRLAPEWYEPGWLPREVARYGTVPDMLPVGSPGKVGVLDLAFENCGGRTELTRHYQKTPLQITRPLYYDERLPDLPHLFMMSSGGGILQGDRHRIDVECGPDSSLHLTTQAATKIYRMEQDYATQLVNLTAGPRCYVEYMPETTIPFIDSRFYQRIELVADPSATVVLADTVMFGRLARGERHAYAAYCGDLEVRRPDGSLVCADTVRLVPSLGVTGPAVLGDHGLMATLHVVTGAVAAAAIADTLHDALAASGLRFGASVLPGESGAWVRILGARSPEVNAALRAAWDATRRLLLGVPVPEPRRY